MLQTEYSFRLPQGYLDEDGTLHRDGVMRLATAGDEILPLKQANVQANPAYLIVIILSRVISRIGAVEHISPALIEKLFAGDLAYLQDFYNQINRTGRTTVPAHCPQCNHEFEVELSGLGGS